MDEIINYASTYRKKEYNNSLYNFIQSLSETARGLDNVVLVVSIPASELEYTPADEADEQRFKKMLVRVGKPIMVSAESETAEIIRRRLFEWNRHAISEAGTLMLTSEAIPTCNEYADWIIANRASLPSWFPIDNAREVFKTTYPFHPTVLSVFERKWQVLPRFQRTRGVLRLLALWVSKAYTEGFKGRLSPQRDALINLGTAPLDDPMFRAAIFEQLGTDKLEGAITTDICGKKDSHAIRQDREAIAAIFQSRLHRKIATTIFFESNGGQSNTIATLPEIRLAVAEPELEIGHVETVLDTLTRECYYLLVNQTKYRFSIYPNLNKILADRRASIPADKISDRLKSEIPKVFPPHGGVQLIYYPQTPSNIPNQPVLTLAILSPDYCTTEANTTPLIESLIREAGSAARTYKSAVMFAYSESDTQMREEARKLLAWEDIKAHETRLDDEQKRELAENLKKAKRDLKESVWRAYKNVAILGKNNQLNIIDLGLVTSSAANHMTSLIINRLRQDGELEDTIHPRFLIRNWSPAFKEWSTKAIRDAFFASPLFPRLSSKDAVKEAIARGVKDGLFAYVGKTSDNNYEPFLFKTSLSLTELEISEDLYIIKAEEAETYLKKITQPFPEESPKTTENNTTPHETLPQPQTSNDLLREDTIIDSLETILPTNLCWSGDIPPQKWMQFYSKVLSKFATDKNLKMKLEIKIVLEGDISPQKRNETKIALQELGLNSDLDM